MYNTVSTYNQNRRFGECSTRLCILNPECSPSFTQRTHINEVRQRLFEPIDQTVQKDVWGPGSARIRQTLTQHELDHGWTVFQRRTFQKTPVLWMTEAPPRVATD